MNHKLALAILAGISISAAGGVAIRAQRTCLSVSGQASASKQ
jgi:hypothetical protein